MSTTATTTTTSTLSLKPKFSPHTYLQGLGWTPGQPLTSAPHARAKPITIAHKKTLSGLGKDRDTSYNWWEAVFEGLAGKVKEAQDRTSTGLISPLPPRPKPSALDSQYHPTPSTSASTSTSTGTLNNGGGGGGLNWEAMGKAKMEMARRQLYASFLRGKVIGSTVGEEEEVVVQEVQVGREEGGLKGKDKEKKKKKKRRADGDEEKVNKEKRKSKKRKVEEEEEKEEVTGKTFKKSKKKDKKDKDRSRKPKDEQGAEVDEAQEIARMVAKEERRREKKLAKAAKKAETGGGGE